MRSTRLQVALPLALLILAAGLAVPLGAQAPGRAQTTVQPPVEAQDPVRAEPPERRRFARPVFRLWQDYWLGPDDVVREITMIFGDARIAGRVEGDVLVVMGTAHLAPTAVIERSLVVVGGSADIESGARVDSELVVIGGTVEAPAEFSPAGDHVVIGSPVFGDALREITPWVTYGLLLGRLIVPDLEWVWVFVLVFFLTYLLLNTALDRPVAATADVIAGRPVSAFVAGLLVLLLSVPVLTIVAASVIGLVIVPFLLCGLIVAALVGKTAVARSIGRGVIRPEPPESRVAGFFAFLIGFAVLTLAYMVPVLGFVMWALTSVLGLGAVTATIRTHLRRERKATAPPPMPPPSPGVPPPAAAAEMQMPPVDTSPPVAASSGSGASTPPSEAPAEPRIAYTAGLAQYPRAMFLDRLAAFVLDCLLVAIASALLDRRGDDGFFFLVLLVYHIAFWAWKGTTLGGIIVNLRVIRTDGQDPRPADAVIRGLSGIFSIAALGIGYLWMLQDPERQTWHDKIAGTLVIKVPRDLVMR